MKSGWWLSVRPNPQRRFEKRSSWATGFGENRVQEAVEKIDVLQDLSGLEWHLVGHLQKNKARFCPGRFQWIHSLDSWNWQKGFPAHVLNKTLAERAYPA